MNAIAVYEDAKQLSFLQLKYTAIAGYSWLRYFNLKFQFHSFFGNKPSLQNHTKPVRQNGFRGRRESIFVSFNIIMPLTL